MKGVGAGPSEDEDGDVYRQCVVCFATPDEDGSGHEPGCRLSGRAV
jgi:hypothetical protein